MTVAPTAPLPFDLFSPGSAQTAVLIAMRLTGIMAIAPVFSAKTVPVMVRSALIVVFTILLQPAIFANVSHLPEITPSTAISETLVGFAIGLGVALLVGAAEVAGDLLATQIGLSGASLLDPMTNMSSPLLGNFFSLFAVTMLLALNVHLGMLEALATSFKTIPPGTSLNLTRGIGTMITLAGSLFIVGLRFAAPIIAAVMIGNAALAVLSRAAPQLNILSVAFPLQIGLGLLALGLALPLIATYFTDWPSQYDRQLSDLFRAFLPDGRR
jgi:flagellar biosynthetic protein FliR